MTHTLLRRTRERGQGHKQREVSCHPDKWNPLEVPAELSSPIEVSAPRGIVGTVNSVEQLMLHFLDPWIGQGVLIDDFEHGFAEPSVIGALIPDRRLDDQRNVSRIVRHHEREFGVQMLGAGRSSVSMVQVGGN